MVVGVGVDAVGCSRSLSDAPDPELAMPPTGGASPLFTAEWTAGAAVAVLLGARAGAAAPKREARLGA